VSVVSTLGTGLEPAPSPVSSPAAGDSLARNRLGYPRRWIISPLADLSLFLGTTLGSLLFISWEWIDRKAASTPLALYIFFICFIDVAHVYSTIYRVYLDPEERARRRLLYFGVIPAVYLIGLSAYLISPRIFWGLCAYYAIFHFTQQLAGFTAIYRRKGEEPDGWRSWAATLDKITVFAGTLYPILWWHAHLEDRRYAWFLHGDFVFDGKLFFGVPEWMARVALPVYLALGVSYLVRSVVTARQKGFVNWGKHAVVAATWITYGSGIVLFNSDVIWIAMIVPLHGIPYLALIWTYGRRRHREGAPGGSRLLHFIFRGPGRFWAFYCIVLFLAFFEEIIWEILVWQDQFFRPGTYIDSVPTLVTENSWWYALWFPLLTIPQAVHYYLDRHLWKAKANPGLGELLGMR
jgi:hypothetical protein